MSYNVKKMSLRFGNNIVEKHTFYCSKCPININKVIVEKTVVSNKFSCGKNDFKDFIGLIYSDKIIPFYIKLSKKSNYVKSFYVLIKN